MRSVRERREKYGSDVFISRVSLLEINGSFFLQILHRRLTGFLSVLYHVRSSSKSFMNASDSSDSVFAERGFALLLDVMFAICIACVL